MGQGTRNHRCLGGMEARYDAAGHCDKEHGDEMRAHGMNAKETGLPNLIQGVSPQKQSEEDADCGQEQDGTENRIDPADDFVDGEQGCRQIIYENNCVNHQQLRSQA